MYRILLVIDMQVDFTTGALGSPAADGIVDGVCARIHAAKEAGEAVMLTLDTHDADYLATQEGRNLPVEHCIAGTPGWMIDPRVAKAIDPGMPIFEKSGFGSEALVGHIRRLAQEVFSPDGKGIHIELCGLCTDVCVVTAALLIKTALPEAALTVNPALCAGLSAQSHLAALTVLRSCQIALEPA